MDPIDPFRQPSAGESHSRVLIMYVGGTIGMKNIQDKGYLPVPGYLSEVLFRMNRFHDPRGFPQEDGKLSKELSCVVKRVASRMKPGSEETVSTIDSSAEVENVETEEEMTTMNADHAGLRRRNSCVEWVPTFITPRSVYGKRTRYSIIEYSPLLDSCNMTMADWVKIATDIEINYELFDAFIVLHGTDTMAYTASALSFMLENLGKTVILTGSQVPMAEVRNDAIENLLGALTIAGHFVIPEVCLYFNNKLFRGNRVTKLDAVDFNAFDSPNMRPLVTVGVNIDVLWSDVLRPNTILKFRAEVKLNPNVATLRLFPGITESTIRAFMAPPIQGLVLESYGSGNAPDSREDLMRALKEATDRGVVIVNCTQCKRGTVTDVYATGKALLKVGVIPGSDMTPECALMKLSFLLGKNITPEECRARIRQNLRGELTVPTAKPKFAFNSRSHTLIQTFVAAAAQQNGPNDDTSVSGNIAPHERLLMEKDLYSVLLCSAAGANDLEGLKLLEGTIGHDLQMNCMDYDGRTPLHIAAGEGYSTCVEFLLLSGASVHLRDRYGHTALNDAVRFRHMDVIQLLRNAGAHFHGDEVEEVGYRVRCAAAAGEVSKLKLYVAAGANMNRKGSDGRTALHMAAAESRVETVAYLLSIPEIDPAPLDRWNRTPLDDAEHTVALTGRGAQSSQMLKEAMKAVKDREIGRKRVTETRGMAGIVGDTWIE